MTPWQVSGIVFGMAACVVAWVWGGRPERFAVGVWLFNTLLSSINYKWDPNGGLLIEVALDSGRLLAFGWLCFRLDRWWPFVVTAALGLSAFTYVARLLDPAATEYAMVSARLGLEYLVDLTLLLSVCERWLAGESAAGPAAWKKADQATAARRSRRGKAARAAVDRGRNQRSTLVVHGSGRSLAGSRPAPPPD